MAKMTLEELRRMRTNPSSNMDKMREAMADERFLLRTGTAEKLRKSLALIGRHDLIGRTLLSEEVRKAHADRLAQRYISRFDDICKSVKARETLTDHEVASRHVRFLTLLHSVTPVSAALAFADVLELKNELANAVKKSNGIWCLGAVEVEVVSMSKMRAVRKRDTLNESEQRKLETCEALAGDLAHTLYANEDSLFLVHLHGIVTARNEHQFANFRRMMEKTSHWTKAKRQIEMTRLSETFSGKKKSVKTSLEHIARYITKGGNDWNNGRSYLNYKFGFEGMDEDTWVRRNAFKDELLKEERVTDGIEDPLSLTAGEISELAILVDKMMGSNRTRDGYKFSTGSRYFSK